MTKKELETLVTSLLAQLEKANHTNEQLSQTIQKLTASNNELLEKIEKLLESIRMNSKNSSKPPSSDGFVKPKSLRTKTGKKQGGQHGHKGSHLSITSKPDDIVQHMPTICAGCIHFNECKGVACVGETRHVIDAVVKTHVTEHQLLVVNKCPLIHSTPKAHFPINVNATVQYGVNLRSLVVALNTEGAVSINRTHEILSSVFNIPLSTGTINNMVTKCANQLESVIADIHTRISNAVLIQTDETGTRVDGRTQWVHTASNADYTYLALHRKRGHLAMDDIGILPNYQGVMVHDCWASYWHYESATHALCCAHLLRELTGVEENHKQSWASDFKKLLLDMKKTKEKALEAEQQELSAYYHRKFDEKYQSILAQAYEINPQPEHTNKRGRPKKGKVLALIERLDKYKASIMLFIHNFMVPFDNNQAERDIRMIKTKTKVSGCFRSEAGAENYLKIMSYIGTAKKQGINPYEAIHKAILGTPEFIFE